MCIIYINMDNKNFNKALESYRMEIIDLSNKGIPLLPADSITTAPTLHLDKAKNTKNGHDLYDAYSLTAILNSY